MKIINKESGKRVGVKITEEDKQHKKKLKEEDPILRNVIKEEEIEEFSAMDPPSAYNSSKTIGSNYDVFHPFIQELMDEHKAVTVKLDDFDKSLKTFKEGGYVFTEEINKSFNEFFVFFDEHIVPHNDKEERQFFRILHKRLVESGEHGTGENPSTAVELMEDDHNKFIQLAALSFNLMGLGTRLRDLESRVVTFDLAYNSGVELVELLKLHIFREDETLFPLAHQLFASEDYQSLE